MKQCDYVEHNTHPTSLHYLKYEVLWEIMKVIGPIQRRRFTNNTVNYPSQFIGNLHLNKKLRVSRSSLGESNICIESTAFVELNQMK